MPRARNIKHSFFSNDVLADNDPLGRLLFIGLWTLADYKGDLLWRDKRVKAQILPYDDCDINKLAINLDKSGFIRFYSDGENIYINICNFDKHQNPHKNERSKGSDTPAYSESMRQVVDLKGLTINRDKSGLIQEHSASNRADSLSLIPDSCNLIPENNNDRSIDQSHAEILEKSFDWFWKIWKDCKKQRGKTDTSPKKNTFDKKWKVIFNQAYFKKHSEEQFKQEVNKMANFCKEAHSVSGFNRFENMQLPKFLNEKQWRDNG